MYKLENGQTISKYCRLNKIPYNCVWTRIVFREMTPEEAVKDYLNKKGKPHFYHWVHGDITLSQYCKNNNLPYQRIINTYYNLNKYNKINRRKISMNEVVKLYENNIFQPQAKYFYNGKTLRSACVDLGIDYIKLMNLYYKTIKKKPYKIEEFVEYYLTNKK